MSRTAGQTFVCLPGQFISLEEQWPQSSTLFTLFTLFTLGGARQTSTLGGAALLTADLHPGWSIDVYYLPASFLSSFLSVFHNVTEDSSKTSTDLQRHI